MCSLTTDLVLSRTKAKDLDSVTILNCWACNLNDVSLLQEMKNIEILILSANELTTLKDIQHCKNLKELYIRSNNLKNLNEIFYLKDLKNLKILWLADDESVLMNDYPNYRLTVLKNLPYLIKLDNKVVTDDEIQHSITIGEIINKPEDVEENYSSKQLDSKHKPSNKNCIENEISNQTGANGVDNKNFEEPENDSTNEDYNENNMSLNSINLELKIAALKVDEEKNENVSRQVSINSQKNQDTSNVLSAILLLVKDLNPENLQTVIEVCQERKCMLESVDFYAN